MDTIELMIGKLQGTVEGIKDDVAILTKEVKSLPCATHDQMLEALNMWKRDCNGLNADKVKSNLSLKNGVIILVLTNLCTLAIALITNAILGGQ